MLLMVGVAGSGKSTQCSLLQDNNKLQWLSVGSLVREKAPKQLKESINAGQLLDDKQIESILTDELANIDLKKLIIDGFPRRLSQAEWLEDYLRKNSANIDAIINLNLPTEITKDRLSRRGRQDDNPAAIEARLLEYEKEIMVIINKFSDNGVLVLQFDANKKAASLHHDIVEQLKIKGVI